MSPIDKKNSMGQVILVIAILSIATPKRAQDTVTPGEQEALV